MAQNRLLSVLVENRMGVLQRVASMIRRRGFNIESLSVGPTEDPSMSRMTIEVHIGVQQAEQAAKQLDKLIDVITVDDITGLDRVAHELLLAKITAPRETREEVQAIVELFKGKIVDVGIGTLMAEVTGESEQIDRFLTLVAPLGIKEIARSGVVALAKGDEARISIGEVSAYEERAKSLGNGFMQDTTGDI